MKKAAKQEQPLPEVTSVDVLPDISMPATPPLTLKARFQQLLRSPHRSMAFLSVATMFMALLFSLVLTAPAVRSPQAYPVTPWTPPLTPPLSPPITPAPTPVSVTGACIVRSEFTSMPSFWAADIGIGYVKKAIPGVNTLNWLQTVCTQAIYDSLFTQFCGQNNNAKAQQQVVTYLASGSVQSTTCGVGTYGCNYRSCPERTSMCGSVPCPQPTMTALPKPTITPSPSFTPRPTPTVTPTATPIATVGPTPKPTPVTPNRPPVIQTFGLPVGYIYQRYQTTVQAIDLDVEDVLTVKLDNLPAGLTMTQCKSKDNVKLVTINCTITGTAKKSGYYYVTMTATDNHQGITIRKFPLFIFGFSLPWRPTDKQ